MTFAAPVILSSFFAACGDDGNNPPPDAAAPDAAPDAPPAFDCETSPATGTHKVFLQFEGATLSPAEISDATQDLSALISGDDPATIPAWRADDPEREAHIQAVVCSLRETLFPYDVEVVTTRPASGEYEMIVIGGRGTDLGYDMPEGAVLLANAATPCERGTNPREVSWVAEFPSLGELQQTPIETANMAAYTLGINGLLNFSTGTTNCMCHPFSIPPCERDQTCAFSEGSQIPEDGHVCDEGPATEDQVEKLETRYGARR